MLVVCKKNKCKGIKLGELTRQNCLVHKMKHCNSIKVIRWMNYSAGIKVNYLKLKNVKF